MKGNAKKILELDGLNILPDGTRIFIRDAFLFGDIRQRACRIIGWNVDVEAVEWLGTPELEYQVVLPNGSACWVSASLVEGYILAV